MKLIKKLTNGKEKIYFTNQIKKGKAIITLAVILIVILVILIVIYFVVLKFNTKTEVESKVQEQFFFDESRLDKPSYTIDEVISDFSINVNMIICDENNVIIDTTNKIFSFKESDHIKFQAKNRTEEKLHTNAVDEKNNKLFTIDIDYGWNESDFISHKKYYEDNEDYLIINENMDSFSYYNKTENNYIVYSIHKIIDGKIFSFEYFESVKNTTFSREEILILLEESSNCVISDDGSPFLEDMIMLIPLVLDKKIITNQDIYEINGDIVTLKKDIENETIEESYQLRINFGNDNTSDNIISTDPYISKYELYPDIFSYIIIDKNSTISFTPIHNLIGVNNGVEGKEELFEFMDMFLTP